MQSLSEASRCDGSVPGWPTWLLASSRAPAARTWRRYVHSFTPRKRGMRDPRLPDEISRRRMTGDWQPAAPSRSCCLPGS